MNHSRELEVSEVPDDYDGMADDPILEKKAKYS